MFISPKDIVVDFLRVNLTDPRSRNELSNTETFSGDSSETSFTLSSPDLNLENTKAGCVTSVSISSVAKTKWVDYYWDEQNQQIHFFTAPATGTDNISVTYKYGLTNWIYPDKPMVALNRTSFPRISISISGGSSERLGNYEAPIIDSPRMQIDVWCKEDNVFTITDVGVSRKYAGDKLCEYLMYKCRLAFKDDEDELFPILFHYVPAGEIVDLPFDVTYQAHHKACDFIIHGINTGEIS